MTDVTSALAVSAGATYVAGKVLGPILGEVGEDLKRAYAKGRDKIMAAAFKKIENPDDGKSANLRVAHDVFTSGAFTDDEVCAQYFGGLLAASRSENGENDDPIQYVNVINTLSSKQLHLHYTIYHALNELLIKHKVGVSLGNQNELSQKRVFFASGELTSLGLDIDRDLFILHRQGLLAAFTTNSHSIAESKFLPYVEITPTTFGILLYAAANNQLANWRKYNTISYGSWEGVELPKLKSFALME